MAQTALDWSCDGPSCEFPRSAAEPMVASRSTVDNESPRILRLDRTTLVPHGLVKGASRVRVKKSTVGTLMTTIQAVMLGVMLALTPSLLLLAVLVWRDGIGLAEEEGERGPQIRSLEL